MTRLSLPLTKIKSHYAVVIVGSGYGGAVAASRLSRAGRSVCVMERGKEFQPGQYPNTEVEVIRETQLDSPHGRIGSRTGLYDFRVNPEISVFVGCGLGGGSLVNANVSLRPDPRVFDDPGWPGALRQDRDTLLREGFRLAEEMLQPTPYPEDWPQLKKLKALERSAASMDARFYRAPLNITFTETINRAGIEQQACVLCGDCVTGCNHGAKNTVLMNYLPDARNHGAEIYTQVGVRRLEKKNGQWLVYCQALEEGSHHFDGPELLLAADLVVLSAGTLGTTEILLRSRKDGLRISDQIGRRFTGNGDVLAFSYNGEEPIGAVGFGDRSAHGRDPVGPCITGIIDLRSQPSLQDGFVVEEGSIPGALGGLIPHAIAASAALFGKGRNSGSASNAAAVREFRSLVEGPYKGAVANTQIYLVMGHDDGAGRLLLKDDRLRVYWPGVGFQPVFQRIDNQLEQLTRPFGGTYLQDPIWNKLNHKALISVHPLGGCPLGETSEQGVVNHKGQVFSSPSGSDVYENLYVCDGSVIPRPLGVNPLLTITALAERCIALMAAERGWRISYHGTAARPPKAPPNPESRKKRSLRLPAPEVHSFDATDGVPLRLTRYQGGKKGPVLLAPGLGTSTLLFSLDTVETNLVEFLFAQGYDVWLLDHRASPELSSAAGDFAVDDIATRDYPTAAAKILGEAGVTTIQAVAHCIGSMSLLMALTAGLKGIRSAVCSTLAFFPVAPSLNEIRAGLHMGCFLSILAQQKLVADFQDEDWKDWLTDAVLRLGPAPRRDLCTSAACRQILAIYGELYGHGQLNAATHDAVHEIFGIASLSLFNHLALMVRRGRIVNRHGEDTYLPNLDRLSIPISFLHGTDNGLFLPEGTLKAFTLLAENNDPRLYRRSLISSYAHHDLFIGKNAARDVFPEILSELELYN